MSGTPTFDLLIVGGGINGAGIARDAAGRGLKVLLVEKDDLASHTSSASTKLIHGGLRYLEQLKFRLVRESLAERERLWSIAPHIVHPLDFVVQQSGSPRPPWLVRLGLLLYDHLGARKRLPPTRTLDLATDPRGAGLKNRAGTAFAYADCFVDDSRLVILNAMDAAERGARIATRTELVHAERGTEMWQATLIGPQGQERVSARVLVNAAGPWVADLLRRIHVESRRHIRLVKGSHIVLPRLYAGGHAVLIQNPDRRVVFAIPFELDFTLVGTTDSFWDDEPGSPAIDDAEVGYLLDAVRRTFVRPVGRDDIVWTFSGIRPLFDDGSRSAARVTRDYSLDLDLQGRARAQRLRRETHDLPPPRRTSLAPPASGLSSRWRAHGPHRRRSPAATCLKEDPPSSSPGFKPNSRKLPGPCSIAWLEPTAPGQGRSSPPASSERPSPVT